MAEIKVIAIFLTFLMIGFGYALGYVIEHFV